MQDTLAIILAGGVGSRLSPLTDHRAKPAVPFGGKYRIIDFTLTNCLHSGVRKILVLTQYKSHSLHKHLRDGWSIFNPELGEYITAVPPQMRKSDKWYEGTADAIFHNLWLLSRSDSRYVIVLSGDHIYRMDYAAMLEEHKAKGAALTVACMEVPRSEASAFGVMATDPQGKIIEFAEKPTEPATQPNRPDHSLASMGIYVFTIDALIACLEADADDPASSHDFGHDIIPKLIDQGSVYSYQFGNEQGRVERDYYWRDVGTIDAYFQANMDLLDPHPPMNLYQDNWPVRTYQAQHPPARTISSATGNEGIFINSIVSTGVVSIGGAVQNSVLSSNVRIEDGAVINDSILLNNVHVGSHCQLSHCIIDKNVTIPSGTVIGHDHQSDAKRFHVSEQGVVVVPEGYQFA